MEDNFWELIASVLPANIELNPKEDDMAEVTDGTNTVTVIYNDADNSYVVDGRTLHFKDVNPEIVNTLLVPYILQELDGNRRF